jgi:hypothetical protein
MFGLRLGQRPVVLCSTTPLPTKWMKNLIKEPDTVSVTVSTYKNMDNLAPSFRKVMLAKYEGTRLGRQELHGEVLEDIVGALWNYNLIEPYRVQRIADNPDAEEKFDDKGLPLQASGRMEVTYEDMERIIVAIDPAGSSDRKRDETGIVVVGKKGDHYYVLEDLSGHYTPEGWSKAAWGAFDKYQADKIVAEKNYGGEMVLSTLRNKRKDGPVDLVTSRRGKVLRAEPIVSLYEQERVHHFEKFDELETQMCEWVPAKDDSPDRVDALVHGITALAGIAPPVGIAVPSGSMSGMSGVAGGAFYDGGLPAHMGYRPREEEQIIKVERVEQVVDRVLQVIRPGTQGADPDCRHDALFESRKHPGIYVCQDCLAEAEFVDTSSAMAHA